MLFLTFSIADVLFIKQKLIWKLYTLAEDLLTTKYIHITSQKKFLIIVLNLDKKAFLVYIAFLSLGLKIFIYLTRKAQIALMLIEKVMILTKNSDFVNIFSKKLAIKGSKHFVINNLLIYPDQIKQPLYCLIYSLRLLELEILKTYIFFFQI